MSLPKTPPSERVLQVIECRLQRIRRADGYHTDLGNSVLRERITLDEDQLPAIVVWENGEQQPGTSAKAYVVAMAVEVEASLLAEPLDAATQIQLAKADIKRALISGPTQALADAHGKLGELIYTGARRSNRIEGGSTLGLVMSFEARFIEERGSL
jgi:hypothetical protein